MLMQIAAALEPLKLVVVGLLFFNLAWIAVRKWLLISVVGVSAGEISLPALWSHAHALGVDLSGAQAPSALGQPGVAAIIIANVVLAAAIWFAVRSLQVWARATVKQHEAEFLMLIERDERQRGT